MNIFYKKKENFIEINTIYLKESRRNVLLCANKLKISPNLCKIETEIKFYELKKIEINLNFFSRII